MNKNLTDITLIVDRSGSMSSMRSSAEEGINDFIRQQKEIAGEAVFSLVQFDEQYELVHNAVNLAKIKPQYRLHPRGSTALLDAIGKTINKTGERLRRLDEDERPGLVVIVIVTDGGENASHEFTRANIREMIKVQADVYKWQFTYLGANQDAFAEAGAIGICRDATANYTASNVGQTYSIASSNVRRMRSATASGAQVQNLYNADERDEMTK